MDDDKVALDLDHYTHGTVHLDRERFHLFSDQYDKVQPEQRIDIFDCSDFFACIRYLENLGKIQHCVRLDLEEVKK